MAENKIAIVTGAGSGVGQCTAIQLSEAGYAVALVARTKSKLEETAELLPGKCIVLPADLTDPVAARSVVHQTVEAFSGLHAVANVAGYAAMHKTHRITDDEWRKMIDTNLSYAVNLCAEALQIMRKSGGGTIVNVSSMSSIDPFPGLGMYGVAKAGLNMYTKVIAQEGDDLNIRAVSIAPGAIETPMLRSLFDENVLPRDQTLDPAEVAGLIVDCITSKRPFISGEVIPLPSHE